MCVATLSSSPLHYLATEAQDEVGENLACELGNDFVVLLVVAEIMNQPCRALQFAVVEETGDKVDVDPAELEGEER